jgi:hypothetical protein
MDSLLHSRLAVGLNSWASICSRLLWHRAGFLDPTAPAIHHADADESGHHGRQGQQHLAKHTWAAIFAASAGLFSWFL